MRRLSLHRPSAAVVISLIALFIAMSGTAVAATGGSFILGKPNTATAVTSLSNTKGTALSLSSTSTTPPLTVSNSVQVPKLNVSELGGQPASDYMTGTGQIAIDTATVASGSTADLTLPGSISHDYSLELQCVSGTALPVIAATGATLQYWFLPPDGQSEVSGVASIGTSVGVEGTTSGATWVVQVAIGSTMATTDWSAAVNASGTCTFAAQTISNG